MLRHLSGPALNLSRVPGEGRCGYYDFLTFERNGQEDENYISTTNHSAN